MVGTLLDRRAACEERNHDDIRGSLDDRILHSDKGGGRNHSLDGHRSNQGEHMDSRARVTFFSLRDTLGSIVYRCVDEFLAHILQSRHLPHFGS